MSEPRNKSRTVRIQVSLDAMSADFLEQLAAYGPLGKNKSEVASRIISQWILNSGADVITDLETIGEKRSGESDD